VKIGDEVKFFARGKNHTGVITDLGLRTHRKANRLGAQFGVRVPDTETATVKVDGMDNAFFKAPLSMLKPTGRSRSGELSQAREVINSITRNRAAAQTARAERGRDTADAQGLYDVKTGDHVEVKFTSGWQRCKFIKLSDSGRVRVENPYGREQWIPAHLVRKV
jgi:hypothetical protein